MPLHKSSRAPRLERTMISAPLDDFRHTMHIGRGGDAFGDTSFLSTHGPGNNNTTTTSSSSSDLGAPGNMTAVDAKIPNINQGENSTDGMEASEYNDLSRDHSESVSSFTLDLDLGPSIMGDVLGVMDGLGLDSNEEDVFSPSNNTSLSEMKSGRGACEDLSVCALNEVNGEELVGSEEKQTRDTGDGSQADGNWSKTKGLRPKVRFSDKREEIIRQASEEEEGQGFTFQGEEDELGPETPTKGEKGANVGVAGETEWTTRRADVPPSPASSHSSDNNESSPLHCRRVETSNFGTDSDEEEEEEVGDGERGYTFEDEFDDEIGL
ncbi:unnamed protein product [Arctogadus glacialis]